MGVAVMSRTCGERPLPSSAPRWSTPEALVDDDEAEIGERDRVLDQGMGPDDHQRLAGRDRLLRPGLDVSLERAGEQGDPDPDPLEQGADRVEVLPGEEIGRGEEGALQTGPGGGGQRGRSDRGLARSDVALEQAEHRGRPREVVARIAAS
jgi:hypothetical protein